MSFRRITKRDNPITIEKHSKECEEVLVKALHLAKTLAKRDYTDVQEMVNTARVHGRIADYKVATIEYPNPKYKSTWYSNMSWKTVQSSSLKQLAEHIVRTAKHNLHASEHNLYTVPVKGRQKKR